MHVDVVEAGAGELRDRLHVRVGIGATDDLLRDALLVTMAAAASKWLGSGGAPDSGPRRAPLGHHWSAVRRAAASDSAQQTVS